MTPLSVESVRRGEEAAGTDLSVEARLNLDLPGQIQFLGVALAALVPLLEDLSESDGVDLNELL